MPGPAGRLQAALTLPAKTTAPLGVAVICHPHPLYGGTFDNKVVTTLARCCTQLGIAALRFNFRGVGDSAGQYSDGMGETEDALTALEWALQETGAVHHIWAGFSFGGWIATRAALARPPAQLVTIAPALRDFDNDALSAVNFPWLLVHSEDDEVVNCAETLSRVTALRDRVDVRMLQGAGHFFHGRLDDLREIVRPVLASRWAELAGG